MGVRPPQQDGDDPEVIEFGIPALAARLDDESVTFPAQREELLETLGDPDIPIDASGQSIALSTALAEVSRSRFDSQQELLNALHPVFESHRNSGSVGVLGSIRSLLPF